MLWLNRLYVFRGLWGRCGWLNWLYSFRYILHFSFLGLSRRLFLEEILNLASCWTKVFLYDFFLIWVLGPKTFRVRLCLLLLLLGLLRLAFDARLRYCSLLQDWLLLFRRGRLLRLLFRCLCFLHLWWWVCGCLLRHTLSKHLRGRWCTLPVDILEWEVGLEIKNVGLGEAVELFNPHLVGSCFL